MIQHLYNTRNNSCSQQGHWQGLETGWPIANYKNLGCPILQYSQITIMNMYCLIDVMEIILRENIQIFA